MEDACGQADLREERFQEQFFTENRRINFEEGAGLPFTPKDISSVSSRRIFCFLPA